VTVWIGGTLAAFGERTESVEVIKERPWGAVARVATTEQVYFFKAVGPDGRHEPRLLAEIASRSPGLAPDVLAVRDDEGWLLMPDHGTAVVDVADPAGQLAAIEQLLPQYSELQRTCAPMADAWVESGIPDRRPDRLVEPLASLLAGEGATGPLPLDRARSKRFESGVGDLERACGLLSEAGVPGSIDHADLHGGNVLVGAGGPRLIDWGDACITHPFASLLVPLEWLVGKLPRDRRPRALGRLCDAYLEPWGPEGSREVLGLAVWVGYVARALSNDQQNSGGKIDHVLDAQREIVALLDTWCAKREQIDAPIGMLAPMLDL
jgi:hypothetical protein